MISADVKAKIKKSGGSILWMFIRRTTFKTWIKYNMKEACVFNMILVGILSILIYIYIYIYIYILFIKNREGECFCLTEQAKSVKNDKSYCRHSLPCSGTGTICHKYNETLYELLHDVRVRIFKN